MRRFVKMITIGAAIAASAALAAAPAVAAEPQIGIVFALPSYMQAYVNGPVTIEMVRVEKWDQMLAAYGSVNQTDGYYIDIYIQRKEGGQWGSQYYITKPFYGGADMKVSLWSLSSPSFVPMSNVAGITEYRIRGQSHYKDGVINLTEMTDWKPFSVNNMMVTSVIEAGDIPAFVPYPPPGGVEASDGSIGQQVKVTWRAVSGAHSYMVLRSTNQAPPPMPLADDKIGKTSGTQYLDSTAALGQVYWYSIRACYDDGCSKQSALDAGWRYTATPTPEMIALSGQGGGGRVVAPGTLRDPAITVAPVGTPTDTGLAIIPPPVRTPTDTGVAAILAPVREPTDTAPAAILAPIVPESAERQSIDAQGIEELSIKGAVPARISR